VSKEFQAVPEYLHTVTPRLVVKGGADAIDFYGKAFGAEVLGELHFMPDGQLVHGEIRIGDSVVFVTDEGDDGEGIAPPSAGGSATAIMALSIPDVDRWWERAVAAGCEVVFPLADQFYGDRAGRLRDPFGQQWILSTHIEDVDNDEVQRRMQAMFEEQA
jgi:PhnB protein